MRSDLSEGILEWFYGSVAEISSVLTTVAAGEGTHPMGVQRHICDPARTVVFEVMAS